MIPIRIKFDARYQQFKLEESFEAYLLEDGEDYSLDSDDPSIDIGIEDFDLETDDFDDNPLIDE